MRTVTSLGRVLAVVPARAGSKGVPGKNLRTVDGRSLVARAVDAALATPAVDTVVVTTDGAAIAAEARAAGALVVERPEALAVDTASSESALLHVLDELEREHGSVPEVLVFLQATSPFQEPAAIQEAVERVRTGAADSVFAAAPSHAFLWRVDAEGRAVAVNHDAAVRPRRQDREPEFRETGAFTVMRTAGFRTHRHRFFGRTELVVVEATTAIDIDDESDLSLADALARTRPAAHADALAPTRSATRDAEPTAARPTNPSGTHQTLQHQP